MERAPRSAPRIRGSWPEIQQASRHLRRALTPAESKLWQALRSRKLGGLKFRRQHPVGPFILDFCCPACKLIVELDGAAHDETEQAERDETRSAQLIAYGYRILRFRNEEVLTDLISVLDRIASTAGRDTQDST
jgi:very-short-patch-repair endonuclease